MRAMVAVFFLVGCGPTWPPGWGDVCETHDDCAPGYQCLGLVEPRGSRCEPTCAASADCTETNWQCNDGYCRLPCGPGWGDCPSGGMCRAGWCLPTR